MKKAKVILIGAEDEENLALRYLAAVLEKDGHETKILPCSKYDDFTKVLKFVSKYKPDLIGISVAFQALAKMYFSLISEIRKQGYKGHVTVGGHFPTFEYKKILETQMGIDSVVRFEGEQAIVELANSIVNNSDFSKITNLVYRIPEGLKENECIYKFQELDKLPFPKRNEKADTRLGEKFSTLVSSRGCWHSSCLYCCIGAFHSKKNEKFALRSSESVAEEIGDLYWKYGTRLFQFHDDNFMLHSKEETLKRLRTLKEAIESKKINTKNIAFLIKARPDTIDEEVASALKDLGTVGVFLGIENASESGLRALIRGSKVEDIYKSMEALKKFDIVVTYNLLIFHPNATLEEIDKNIEFMKNHKELPFDFGRAEIVAGSPLERLVISKNSLEGEWPNWSYKLDNETVDKMFRMNVSLFRRKDSPYSNLMQSSIALAYQAYVLRRLHQGKVADKIIADTHELIKQINTFVIEKIEKIRYFAENPTKHEEVEKIYNELSKGSKKYLDDIINLKKRMLRLQTVDRAFRFFKVGDAVQESSLVKSIFSFE
jgi:radical SAM superfamily enzyme YgiQ (UPF0313 family)